MRRTGPHTIPWAAFALWCVLFALPHVAWALGSRWGLGDQSDAADAALATTWFFAYNAVTIALAVCGAVLAAAQSAALITLLPKFTVLAQVLAGVLLIRGTIGVLGLAASGIDGIRDTPPILLAVEAWFLLGAVLIWWITRRSPANVDERTAPAA